jgi:hypothetical protein
MISELIGKTIILDERMSPYPPGLGQWTRALGEMNSLTDELEGFVKSRAPRVDVL